MKNRKKDIDNSIIKKFTIIDFLICVIIIAASVYVGMRFFNLGNSNEDKEVEYSVVLILPDERSTNFKSGDIVLSSDGMSSIGKVVNVSVLPATKNTFNLTNSSDNVLIKDYIDGYVEVTVTVSAELVFEFDSYYLNGSPIKVNSDIEITTKDFSAYGKCMSISE